MARRPFRIVASIVAAIIGLLAAAAASPWIYVWGAGTLWDRAEPEVHLIPVGYRGPVVILLGDSAAGRKEREGRARLFRISAVGVARSAFGNNEGWGRHDYFYIDSQGRRSRIVSGTPCERNLAGDPVQACLLGHTTFASRPDRHYEAYVVGRSADQQVWERRADRFVDSVVYGRPTP